MKNQSGITLVALIITIIVLLILATVSISLVMNGGIINKAEYGTTKYTEAEICEQIKLAYSEYAMKQYEGTTETAEKIIGDRLKETIGDENLTATVKNGKVIVNTIVNDEPKKYIFKSSTGEAYEYQDPFDYGTKTKKTLVPGDDITLGTEKFRVFYNQDGVIKAMPWYNIELKLDDPKQSSSAKTTTFASEVYWPKSNDAIDMSDERNNVQKYIIKYKETLEKLGLEEIEVRIASRKELEIQGVSSSMRNPGKVGDFWLDSCNTSRSNANFVLMINSLGNFDDSMYSRGVRPIIIIEY